ncbi:MAG: hypothetical protein EXR66_01675 [Dehalococcoidia bacterium]|nr:hypothetical protein [Dehalococcoidia bacterium]
MRHSLATLLPVATIVAFLAACAGKDASTTEAPSFSGGDGGAIGPGISIAAARRSRLDGPLLVCGYVLADGSKVRLCDALAESHHPQCSGPSLEVHGSDTTSLTASAGNTRWSADQRLLLGEVKNGVLTVSGASKG